MGRGGIRRPQAQDVGYEWRTPGPYRTSIRRSVSLGGVHGPGAQGLRTGPGWRCIGPAAGRRTGPVHRPMKAMHRPRACSPFQAEGLEGLEGYEGARQ